MVVLTSLKLEDMCVVLSCHIELSSVVNVVSLPQCKL